MEGAGKRGACSQLAGGWGSCPAGRTSSRACKPDPQQGAGWREGGCEPGRGTHPAALQPAWSQPLRPRDGTFTPARILSWQRMGNDESSLPQPHPARPKESSAAFEVAFKGSQNEDERGFDLQLLLQRYKNSCELEPET